MRIQLAPGFKNTGKNTIGKDVLAGLILMAVSIPISMGYAQIAGLPAVYGLYGSVFPIPHHRSLSLEWMRLRRHW